MRIWDISTGYLNDKSLLGEHRELHGIMSVLMFQKKGYSRHPETLRFTGRLNALSFRHSLLVEEMSLRGFNHRSPVAEPVDPVLMPQEWIDSPGKQYRILEEKYRTRSQGPIPLPSNTLSLWASHKYSVMARDYNAYKRIGRQVADRRIGFEDLAAGMTGFLYTPPPEPALVNALYHMWGYVSGFTSSKPDKSHPVQWIRFIRKLALQGSVTYLMHSTAIRELPCWCNLSDQNGDLS